jgi:hypothetical protein
MGLSGAVIGALSVSVLAGPSVRAEDEAATAPDFSGVWWRNAMDPELPVAGPGPLVNLRRPYNDLTNNGGGDPIPLVGDYNNPILKPNAIEAVKKAGELSAGGRINPDPSNQCAAYSPPYLFTIQLGVQMIQMKDQIVMLYPQDDQVRRVRLNASHPEHVTPSPMGDSIGHYEGDTLVIDTIGVQLGPVTMVDRYGTPQSEAMHLVERYRLIDGGEAQAAMEEHQRRAGRAGGAAFMPEYKGLRLDYTVEDSGVFTMPWSARITYRRTMQPWAEQICAENIVEYWPGMNIGVPKAEKPDF